jgi:hypothetical protein
MALCAALGPEAALLEAYRYVLMASDAARHAASLVFHARISREKSTTRGGGAPAQNGWHLACSSSACVKVHT